MSGCDHSGLDAGDYDRIGFAILDDDGETLTLVDRLSPETVDLIKTSAHRLEIRVRFVADHERFRGPNGELL